MIGIGILRRFLRELCDTKDNISLLVNTVFKFMYVLFDFN